MMKNKYLTIIQYFLFSPICGCREGEGVLNALLNFVQICEKSLDSEGTAREVLTDFSKVFDCLYHQLVIATLDACGFSRSGLMFIYSY